MIVPCVVSEKVDDSVPLSCLLPSFLLGGFLPCDFFKKWFHLLVGFPFACLQRLVVWFGFASTCPQTNNPSRIPPALLDGSL